MKEYDSHLMRFKITNDKLKMEINLKDLVYLYNTDLDNWNGETDEPFTTINPKKTQDFAEHLVELLMDDDPTDGNRPRWGLLFKDSFDEICESVEDFCEYSEEEDE